MYFIVLTQKPPNCTKLCEIEANSLISMTHIILFQFLMLFGNGPKITVRAPLWWLHKNEMVDYDDFSSKFFAVKLFVFCFCWQSWDFRVTWSLARVRSFRQVAWICAPSQRSRDCSRESASQAITNNIADPHYSLSFVLILNCSYSRKV